jgi:hypothetical protein
MAEVEACPEGRHELLCPARLNCKPMSRRKEAIVRRDRIMVNLWGIHAVVEQYRRSLLVSLRSP